MKTERKPKSCSCCEKPLSPHKRREPICFDCYSAIRKQAGNLYAVAQLLKENENLRLMLKRELNKSIPPAMLDKLIRLAHPDRHNGSQAANDVTAWLLSQRVPA